MKTSQTHANSASVQESFGYLNVLVVYEDFAAANHAQKIFDGLLGQPGDDAEFCPMMWKFDMLRNEKLNEMAAMDAAMADVVIIATGRDGLVPEEVKNWMNRWLSQREKLRTAITVVSDPGTESGC